MAEVLHGTAVWPGVVTVLDCTYTCSQGISPGTAMLNIAPQLLPPALNGLLIISDGQTDIYLPNCKLQRIYDHKDEHGEVWTLEILDRRWMWRDCGSIRGCFNQKDKYGHYLPWTVQTPFQLAELCLLAMGETNYKIVLPGQVGELPPVDWDHDNPAQVLSALVEAMGCRVIYQLGTDSVLIAPIGVGDPLPPGSIAREGPSLKAPPAPSAILLSGAPQRFQARFRLYPVGLDWDGRYRPIQYLTYAPKAVLRPQITVLTPVNPDLGVPLESYDVTVTEVDIVGNKIIQTDQASASAALSEVPTATEAEAISFITSSIQQQLAENPNLSGWTITRSRTDITIQGPPGVAFNCDTSVTGKPDPDEDDADDAGEPAASDADFLVSVIQDALDGSNPWAQCPPPLFPGVQATDRLTRLQAMELARKSVFKMYALILVDPSALLPLNPLAPAPAIPPLKVPGYSGPILRSQQIMLQESQVLQIVPTLLDEREKYPDGRSVRQFYYDGYSKDVPAQCFGSYYTGLDAGGPGPNVAPPPPGGGTLVNQVPGSPPPVYTGNTDPAFEITIPFSIDSVYNVVIFSDYVFTVESGAIWPADPVLQTACNIRDALTNQVVRYEQVLPVPGGQVGSPPAVIQRPDVQLNWLAIYDPRSNKVTSLANDLALAEAMGTFYLTGELARYLPSGALEREYNGIMPINLDGAVMQTTWSVGGAGAKTAASLNTEHHPYLPTLPQRRWLEYLPSFAEQLRFKGMVNGRMWNAAQGPVRDRIGLGGTLVGPNEF